MHACRYVVLKLAIVGLVQLVAATQNEPRHAVVIARACLFLSVELCAKSCQRILVFCGETFALRCALFIRRLEQCLKLDELFSALLFAKPEEEQDHGKRHAWRPRAKLLRV